MLEIKNLCAGYAGKPVLENVSVSIPSGQVTVVLGPNGCGKSTLLKALCGILRVTEGKVMLDGQSILPLPRKQLAQKIAFLAQNRQIPDITVRRLVLHGRFPYLSYPRHYRPEDHTATKAAMEQMGIVDLADMPLTQLSGGQRQKAYIAMALAQDTPVIVLDEPTTYLDISHQMQMMRLAKDLSSQGKTVVMVIHDLSHAMQVADRVVLMDGGCVITQGTPEAVFASGRLNAVFGVKLCRVKTGSGWQYYCKEG